MTPPRTVLFDLDGTLIDSIELIIESYQHTIHAHRLPSITREEIVAGIGTPLVAVFGRWTDDAGAIEEWIATYRSYNLTHHDSRVRAFPGAVEMVRRVQAAGRRLGLVTSKNNAGARRGLALVGLDGVMEVIVGADDVTRHKPDPEPVRRALEQLGSPASEAVYIGDSHHDVASGRAAGVRTIAVCWGPIPGERLTAAGADRVCATPEEVLAELEVAG
jgi:pyrophosphatase PpaX